MSRGLRTIGIIAAALFLAAVMPTSSGLGRGEPLAAVIIISPPAGLGLPIGQAVEVRYYIVGAATAFELWADDTLVAVNRVQSGQEVAHVWAPAALGPHRLTVRALDERGTLLATAERRVSGLPRGSPVRLRAER
jgi:hypothetical protein